MGATRKLATMVAIGLTVLATVLFAFNFRDSTRRTDEVYEQGAMSIERGTNTFITYCLQCHGPTGLGMAELNAEGQPMGRVGGVLNQSLMSPEQLDRTNAVFQSDDPVLQAQAEEWIRFRIMYGIPPDNQLVQHPSQPIRMPSFRRDLSVEQINDLVYLITHGDWNYVYNTAVTLTGQTVCEANPETAGDCDDAPPVYPTVPPTAAPTEDAAAPAETPAPAADATPNASSADATPADGSADVAAPSGEGQRIEISAFDDLSYSLKDITVQPGDTIVFTNEGFLQHDFNVDELDIHTELLNASQTVEIVIPADAEPGSYEFYCSVSGHRAGGMFGTITVEAP